MTATTSGMLTVDPVALISLIVLLAANLLAMGIAWGVLITRVAALQRTVSREGDDGLIGRRELVTALEDNRRVHAEIKGEVRGLATSVGYHGEHLGALDATVKALQKN